MARLASLAAGDVRTVVERFSELLDAHRDVINRLNVYPVPDGDTGTNMSLTVASVVRELHALPEAATMAGVCKAVAHGSLMGARGNSGVILSQLLRGMSTRLSAAPACGSAEVAEALVEAAALARTAVVRPVEGTILTVAQAAGEGAATSAAVGADLCSTLE
ncbi:MAG TPA: DAK2 domain-containing protein, partial [Acidimicrobiales bacterium]|nr:DAK2 domain-containing protein [Acidimicrobiales bacterium]